SNPESALSILKRMPGKLDLPDMILIDASLKDSSLITLQRFLSVHPNLSMVPFVLDASGLGENEVKKMRKIRFFDELLFLDDVDPGKLMLKINFLKKVKIQARQNLPGPETLLVMPPHWKLKDVVKRVFDVSVASMALAVTSPLFLLIACAIRFESTGPVFYVAKRAGRGYRVFDFFKFRTMIAGADEQMVEMARLNQYQAESGKSPIFYKFTNDPRITKVGAFLRNTSLDELPQLFNVLLGNMSLVGNRPLPLYEAANLTTDQLAARFMAPVGMTGLWQIKKRGLEKMSVEERINLDIDYARKNNFLYDLWIMLNTPSALLQKTDV
ncbi:MAG TPA: sugar transferase, partial [Chitinophagaceae bacterium]|nr:sugar transferase [Chitinophagaceae bacterium]